MRKISEMAINQCIAELRAACRLPIEEPALDTLIEGLRPNFQRILDCSDGRKRWAGHGQRMRNNGRYIGAFANFFADHVSAAVVGRSELTRAFEIVREHCAVRADSGPLACEDPPVDARAAEELLKPVVPTRDPLHSGG
ncbi:MAG: hypothetical protein GEV06_07460 [Luteitalea sp.]|nr:hypothetical protein [Luteitalea sp.]